MSLGVAASCTLETAVKNAWSKGVVLGAAAGNGGGQTKIYPGAYPNVLAVARDAEQPLLRVRRRQRDINVRTDRRCHCRACLELPRRRHEHVSPRKY